MTLVIYQNWVFELFLWIMIMNSRKRPDNCWGLLSVAGSSYRPTLVVNLNWTKWEVIECGVQLKIFKITFQLQVLEIISVYKII
jgi:hypothetical protein